jgi:formylglycine-generating enzyme required for sulfatase activity
MTNNFTFSINQSQDSHNLLFTMNIFRISSWLVVLTMSLSFSYANYLRIQGVSYDQTAGTVSFEIAWNNSWNIDGLGAPNHWDAAWVFVKWRECGVAPNVGWTHGLINTTVGSHTFSGLEPTLADGSAVGIDPAPNNTGVMLRRTTPGLYPNAGFSTVSLALTNFPTTGDYEVKVLGIEMVYVPQGPFVAGGLNETSCLNINGNTFLVDSEDSITVSTTYGIRQDYPKGYDPFYCMKYEITQGQYAAFLNTLDATAQTQHFLGNFNSWRNRTNTGGTPPNVYFSDRPDRAQNFLAWTDLLAYLDWAALRPMSELEYEKACRGNGPYVGGYAWGTTDIIELLNITSPEDGTEVSSTPNANVHYRSASTTVGGGDGGSGPVRVGIFATAATSSRVETGATYYGIMEMSGNVGELCVVANPNHPDMTNFDRSWGDGYLDASGAADVAAWPLANAPIGQYVWSGGNYVFVSRGGHHYSVESALRIAARDLQTYNRRYDEYGGRGIR